MSFSRLAQRLRSRRAKVFGYKLAASDHAPSQESAPDSIQDSDTKNNVDYDSMKYWDLLELLTEEELDSLPNRKKATIIEYLKTKG